MKPKDILAGVRDIIQDPTSDAGGAITPRDSDDDLLRWVSEAEALAMMVRPEFYGVTADFACVDGALQVVSGVTAVLDVQGIKNGSRVSPFQKAVLDAFNPSWTTGTRGPAQQVERDGNDPRQFWVYPPAPAGQVLDVKRLPLPNSYASADLDNVMPSPDWMLAPMVSYVVARSESKDDENVSNGRVTAMNQQFADAIKAGQGTQ